MKIFHKFLFALLILVTGLMLPGQAFAGYGRSVVGYTPLINSVGNGNVPTTTTMAVVNNAVDFRFVAEKTTDIASVWVNWSSVSAPGTVRVRIETDSSGKASGTLYDAAATVDITPSAGWQQCVFSVTPTTHTTVGSLYHILLLTTVAGTTQTLRTYWGPNNGGFPVNALTATDGSTRSNLAENTNSVPVCTVVYSDASEDTVGFAPFASSTNFAIYGTRAAGVKFTVPTGVTESIVGVVVEGLNRNGTPAALRARIFDSGGTQVTNASVSVSDSALTNASSRRIVLRFGSAISVTAGAYRVALDAVGNASTSGNNWTLYSAAYRSSTLQPTYLQTTTTTDITAGTVTWTDSSTDVPTIGLQFNDASGSGSTGSPHIIGGGIG